MKITSVRLSERSTTLTSADAGVIRKFHVGISVRETIFHKAIEGGGGRRRKTMEETTSRNFELVVMH